MKITIPSMLHCTLYKVAMCGALKRLNFRESLIKKRGDWNCKHCHFSNFAINETRKSMKQENQILYHLVITTKDKLVQHITKKEYKPTCQTNSICSQWDQMLSRIISSDIISHIMYNVHKH